VHSCRSRQVALDRLSLEHNPHLVSTSTPAGSSAWFQVPLALKRRVQRNLARRSTEMPVSLRLQSIDACDVAFFTVVSMRLAENSTSECVGSIFQVVRVPAAACTEVIVFPCRLRLVREPPAWGPGSGV
jgi:hypothetical protein